MNGSAKGLCTMNLAFTPRDGAPLSALLHHIRALNALYLPYKGVHNRGREG